MREIYLFLKPGFVEVFRFGVNHLLSGMVPAFFIAGAIAVFLDKQKITRLLGPKTHPLVSYPMASFAGAILTVCSCGVIPIFSGILQRGAGIGPAFTFLFAAPAINLIAVTYTYTYFGAGFAFSRIISVLVCSILIGIGMKFIFGDGERQEPSPAVVMVEDDDSRPLAADLGMFVMLILIMMTSTGVFDFLLKPDSTPVSTPMFSARIVGRIEVLLIKLLVIFGQLLILSGIAYFNFRREEIIQWLRKAKDLFIMIIPKVLAGIFVTGIIAERLPLTSLLGFFSANTIPGNLLMGIMGSLMYFGTIVGVNVVKMLVNYGMNMGPALTLFLSGPSVSFPSILAIAPIVGKWRAAVFFLLVVLFSSASGFLYGMMF